MLSGFFQPFPYSTVTLFTVLNPLLNNISIYSINSSTVFCRESLMESLISFHIITVFQISSQILSILSSNSPVAQMQHLLTSFDVSLFIRRYAKCPSGSGWICTYFSYSSGVRVRVRVSYFIWQDHFLYSSLLMLILNICMV